MYGANWIPFLITFGVVCAVVGVGLWHLAAWLIHHVNVGWTP